MGTVEQIFIAPSRQSAVQEAKAVELEAGRGIVGDRYHALAEKAQQSERTVRENHLTLIAKEELDNFLANHSSDLHYGEFRRNIITSGIDLNTLVKQQFRIGDALCQGIELCEPCATLARTVHSGVLPGLVHKGGLRAVVLESGNVQVGSTITASQ
ncbi:MAG: MOSC domain-containing protein [Proteobacteria bacterium]|nr:MOSC domain-containing protein [Pseudomonadota bacterium]